MKLPLSLTWFVAIVSGSTRVFYWDVKPYIWKEGNHTMGSIPYTLQAVTQLCNFPPMKFYHVEGGYKEWMEALVRNTVVLTDHGRVDISNRDMWVPFMEPREVRGGKTITFFEPKQMVVIVPRYKIEIMYKILLGVRRSFNFLAVCLIMAFIAGALIWFIVSMICLN